MTPRLTIVLLLGLFGAPAFAQADEDEWAPPPVSTRPPAAQPDVLPPPPLPPPPPAPRAPLPYTPSPYVPPSPYAARPSPRPEVTARVRPPEPRNDVSVLGAQALGQWKRAQLFQLGFPVLTLRMLIGLTDRLDVGAAFDSYYFLMNEPRLVARFTIAQGEEWAFAASLEGGYAFFAQRASREQRSARWLTGRRNVNLSPALVVSYQGPQPRAARLFFEARYTLALDTEPYATDPLVGVPPGVVPGHNVGLRGGAELPLSAKTAFVFALGLDVHGRDIDSVMMPGLSVGLVTSL